MKGTSVSVTEAILLSPPTITSPARIIRMIPVTRLGIPKAEFTLTAIEFIWLILPIPNDAITQNPLNITARNAPTFSRPGLEPRPSLR